MDHDTQNDYFEILTSRFGLERLESNTSLMGRAMVDNQIPTANFFGGMIYSKKYAQRIFLIDDYPPVSWGRLPVLMTQTEDQLIRGTFYFLINRFTYSNLSKNDKAFLGDSVSKQVRFCPLCLKEKGYFRLIWRFGHLVGCPIHNVYLVDQCPSCGEKVKLLRPNPKIGFCHNCETDLSQAPQIHLPDELIEKNLKFAQDLEFLLSPFSEEDRTTIKYDFGPRFWEFRKKENISVKDLSPMIGIDQYQIYALERGDYRYGLPGTFENYVKFMDILGISFRDFFSPELIGQLEDKIKYRSRSTNGVNNESFDKDQEISKRILKACYDIEYTSGILSVEEICSRIELDERTVQRYPNAWAILSDIKKRIDKAKKQKEHDELEVNICLLVKQIISQLKDEGKRITIQEIVKRTGYSIRYLRSFDSVNHILSMFAGNTRRKSYPEKSATAQRLIGKFLHAVAILKNETKGPIDISKIAEMCGVSVSYLRRFSEIKEYLLDLKHGKFERKGEELLDKVKDAHRILKLGYEYVSEYDIAYALSVPLSTLMNFSQTHDYLLKLKAENKKLLKIYNND